jgi:phosphoglycolate phosphatase-like HAD superfamily hydrolase
MWDHILGKNMNDKKIIVFDVDGTLANCDHRRHYVACKPKNWGAFNRAMKFDTPHDDIIWLYKLMKDAGHTILIASGRGEENRRDTEIWLASVGVVPSKIYMRPANDHRKDDIIKAELLEQIRAEYGEPYMVIDDRQQVVDMWRANGIRCLQVAPGSF